MIVGPRKYSLESLLLRLSWLVLVPGLLPLGHQMFSVGVRPA